MHARTFGAFVVGFVLGAIALGATLWFTGELRWPVVWAQPATAASPAPSGVPATGSGTPAAPVDNSMPNLSAAVKQPPLVPPPGELPQTVKPQETSAQQPPAPQQGSADRTVEPGSEPDVDHPVVPISGITANQITDTFFDNRDGHEHEALDIPSPRGTPVVAAVEGNVAKLFQSKQGGTTVYQFDDSGKYCYYYAHLDRYAPGLKEGMLLRQGQVLGYVGTTGNAPKNTPHLHFAVFRMGADKSWWKGTAVDPLPWLRADGR